MSPRLQKLFNRIIEGNAAKAFFGIFQGRFTFFACIFAAIGCYGWLVLARDLTSFALLVGAIQALLLAHSYKEDINAQNQAQAQQQSTQVVNNITVDPNIPPQAGK